MKRSRVMLGVSAVVVNEQGEWLVVKKQYSGLKNMWSMCAGLVDNGERIDEAILRELLEETGIEGKVEGIIGVRSGVINNDLSDNMVVFEVTPLTTRVTEHIPNDEIADVKWESEANLLVDQNCSPMIHELIKHKRTSIPLSSTKAPGPQG